MTAHLVWTCQWLLMSVCCFAVIYGAFAAVAMPIFGTERSGDAPIDASRPVPAISVLKPLCGAEPRLFENLATFCEQTHPCFQLLFGVSSPRIGSGNRHC